MITVTFDQALVPGVSAPANWSAQADVGTGRRDWFVTAPAVIAGSTVTYGTASFGTVPGPDVIAYLAAPPDLVGLVSGLPAAAFAGFPLTVVP